MKKLWIKIFNWFKNLFNKKQDETIYIPFEQKPLKVVKTAKELKLEQYKAKKRRKRNIRNRIARKSRKLNRRK